VPKSAAEAAGLRVGDLILKLDGVEMKSVNDCTQILSRKWSGDPLRMQVLRDGAALDIDIVLGGR
jgi:serine protease Do